MTPLSMKRNRVVQTADGWQIYIAGLLQSTIWNSQEAAEAGLQTELRRREKKQAELVNSLRRPA